MRADLIETEKALKFYGGYENFLELQHYQEPDQRKFYMESVCEAVSTNSGKAAMLQKLYSDIQGKSNIDTSLIDESRGIFTKFKGFKTTMSAIEILENLFDNENDSAVGVYKKDVALIRALADSLTNYRKQFEDGYRIKDFTIMSFYRVTVLNVLELINICTVNYMLAVRGKASENGIKPGEFRKVRTNAEMNLKSFNNGDFIKVSKALLKGKVGVGNEALGDTKLVKGFVGFMTGGAPAIAKIVAGGAAIIIAAFTLFHVIRVAIYYFFAANAKVETWLSTQSELIQFSADQDRTDGSVEKKEKQVRKMQSMARFIRVKILKTEQEAEKVETAEAKTTYSKNSIDEIAEITAEPDYDDDEPSSSVPMGGFTF